METTNITEDKNLIDANKTVSKKNKRKQKNKTRAQRHKERNPKPDYAPIVKNNDNFVSYYKSQSFLENDEFDRFIEGLRDTLPASFRINTFDPCQAEFLKRLVQGPELGQFLEQPVKDEPAKDNDETECNVEHPTEIQSQKPAVLAPLCWYPDKLAWQMNTTRLDLKRSPILQQFHRFLMAETDNGFISRQEAVSMIPPLVLDIHRGQDVLDMCAAPGSKTAQLLEYLKKDPQGMKGAESVDSITFNDGMVVANDVDNKRCYMLVHQSNRLNSPNCIIINQDAARIHDMKIAIKDNVESLLKFDRILCDVPCSGDGTLRKNPDVWKKWTVGNANNFHGMQCKILKRGIELLKKDGRLTYSTCSMNPVEDEAVISNILRLSQGGVVLDNIEPMLPGLKYRPGVSEWVVMNKEMLIIPSADKVPSENATQIYPSLFPPSKEESGKFQLHKCIRILPHLQNTGGFFVATLRKLVDELPWETETKKTSKSTDTNDPTIGRPLPNPKKRRLAGFKEDPFMFMTTDDPDWVTIKNGYGFSDDFPVDQLMHRCVSGKKRSIYLVSRRVRDFIIANREEAGRDDFVKIINGGMRLFCRADTEAGFRICQDGVNEILPHVKSEIKVPINKDDLVALLKAKSVAFDRLSAAQQIKDTIKYGCLVLIYRDTIEEGNQKIEMPLVAWKGEHTIALYVSKTYRIHLCALTQVKISEDGMLNHPVTADREEQ